MSDYEKYEAECKKIKKDNAKLLTNFKIWLQKKGITDETISNHIGNVDLYINDFLLYEDAIEAKNGALDIGMYLGYWFIKKAMWASPAQIKKNAGSLKKFYTFLFAEKLITKEVLNDLKEKIKEEMPDWIGTMERYDNPEIEDMEDVWNI